jgi:hypothetical protein
VPKRSLFYGLPLEGVGTWEVESLRSFVERLAYAHCFKPLALLEKLLAHFPLGEAKLSLLAVVRFWDVHGTANAGNLVTERLELATLTKLASAGLRRFAHVLSPAHLARSKHERAVYCPACVAEGDELGHGRLLWEVQCVTGLPEAQGASALGRGLRRAERGEGAGEQAACVAFGVRWVRQHWLQVREGSPLMGRRHPRSG